MVEQHSDDTKNIKNNFKVLRKCQEKSDCLLNEILN